MIRVFLVVCISFFCSAAFAQNYDFLNNEADDLNSEANKVESAVTVGSEVATTFKNSSYWSNYILPSLSYDVNERLTIKMGIGVYHTYYNNTQTLMNERTFTTINGGVSSIFGYAMGVYAVSSKLDLIGGYTFSEAMPNNSVNYINSSTKAGSVGFNYKVSSNLSMGVQVGFSNLPQMGLGGISNGLVNNGPMNYMLP
jgi:hypothetical protein